MSNVSQPPPLPGFGLPLNFTPCAQTVVKTRDGSEVIEARGEGKPLFQTAFPYETKSQKKKELLLLTLREIAMLKFINDITDKPGWESKIFDASKTEKWKAQALAIGTKRFTPAMAAYCIDELKYKAELFQKTGAVSIFYGDVVKADDCIPADLKNALRAAVAVLENIPNKRKDWRSGSNETVLDLVHPSLYPLTYGLTRIMPDGVVDLETCLTKSGDGKTISVPPETETYPNVMRNSDIGQKLGSDKFQWLPCDVDISGETPRITSYINNLHPQRNASLYRVIESIIGKIIPLWDLTLGPLRDFVYQRRIVIGDDPNTPEPRLWNHDYSVNETNFFHIPDAKVFTKPESLKNPVNLKADYGHRGLQVIVKLANIHLTPEKPEYGGGEWHMNGYLNEHICASAIYYFDDENITPSRLGFLQEPVVPEIPTELHEDHEFKWLGGIFGFRIWDSFLRQKVGSIETREDRVITFPNLLLHQVRPFKLADPTRPGHRKILALYLVDPHIRIISTANVPCQQLDWWSYAISNSVTGRLARLPREIRDIIIDEVADFPYPISLETAKQLREEMVEERISLVDI